MFWSFLAVFFSGWLSVEAAYRGPPWQHYLFKILTFILLLIWAWQAPHTQLLDYLLLAGLAAALLSSGLSLLGEQHQLWTLGGLFMSALLYSLALIKDITFYGSLLLPAVLVGIGSAVLFLIWRTLGAMRWPAIILLLMTLTLSWLATLHWLTQQQPATLSIMIGANFLLFFTIIGLISQFRRRFVADYAIHQSLFIIGHFMMARSLWLN